MYYFPYIYINIFIYFLRPTSWFLHIFSEDMAREKCCLMLLFAFPLRYGYAFCSCRKPGYWLGCRTGSLNLGMFWLFAFVCFYFVFWGNKKGQINSLFGHTKCEGMQPAYVAFRSCGRQQLHFHYFVWSGYVSYRRQSTIWGLTVQHDQVGICGEKRRVSGKIHPWKKTDVLKKKLA